MSIMNFFTIVSTFFIIFFSFQLLVGRAGIVSLMQERYIVARMTENYNQLVQIQKDLDAQISLAENSKRYLEVFAHRVGLVSDDEFYIRLENSMFNKGNSYTPGTLILFEESFYVSNSILFFISFAIECMLVSLKLYRRKQRIQERTIRTAKLHSSIPTHVSTHAYTTRSQNDTHPIQKEYAHKEHDTSHRENIHTPVAVD